MQCYAKDRTIRTHTGEKIEVNCAAISDNKYRVKNCNTDCPFYKPLGQENEVMNLNGRLVPYPPHVKEKIDLARMGCDDGTL